MSYTFYIDPCDNRVIILRNKILKVLYLDSLSSPAYSTQETMICYKCHHMLTNNANPSKMSYKMLEKALICVLRAIYPISLRCSFLSIALISIISDKSLKIHIHHVIRKYELILVKLLCSIISCYEFLQIEYKRFHASGDRKGCGNISTFCITFYPVLCKNVRRSVYMI